jgi:hypothetical protein
MTHPTSPLRRPPPRPAASAVQATPVAAPVQAGPIQPAVEPTGSPSPVTSDVLVEIAARVLDARRVPVHEGYRAPALFPSDQLKAIRAGDRIVVAIVPGYPDMPDQDGYVRLGQDGFEDWIRAKVKRYREVVGAAPALVIDPRGVVVPQAIWGGK